MSPIVRGKNIRGSVLAVLVAVTVLGGGVGIWQATSGGPSGPPPPNNGNNPSNPLVYNVFVAPGSAGNDADTINCKWYSPPVATATSPGHGCQTFQKAMILAVQNGAATNGANVGVLGNSTIYAYPNWDVCTNNLSAAQGRFNAQCLTLDTATNFIDYWKDPASTSDPTMVGSGGMLLSGSHIRIHGPFNEDTTNCDISLQSGGNNCPAASVSAYTSGADQPTPHDDVIEGVHASIMFITTAYNVTYRNDNFGPAVDDHGIVHIKSCDAPPLDPATDPPDCDVAFRPHDILLDNVVVHDQYNSSFCLGPTNPCGPEHMGCGPTFNDSYNVTIKESQFYNCQDTAMLLKQGVYTDDHFTFVNDYYGQSSNGLQLNDTSCTAGCFTDIKIYASTFNANAGGKLQPLGGSDANCVNCELRGNIITTNNNWTTFGSGWTITNNYTKQSTTCGGGATCTSNVQVVDYGTDTDFIHLLPTSPLQHVLPSGLAFMPVDDIDGNTRSATPSPGADDGITTGGASGVSVAKCTPEPCNAVTGTTYTGLTFDDGAGKQKTQSYTVYRSSNLTNSPTNPVPVVFSDCGSATANQSGTETLLTVAATNHFIVVCANPPTHNSVNPTPPPTYNTSTVYVRGSTGWVNVSTTFDPSTSAVCGNHTPLADQPCDDVPFIVAQLADIQNGTSSGSPAPNENIDPTKVWGTGGSNGGQFYAWEMMCNPLSSGLFAGFGQISALFQSVTQATPTVCPAVTAGSHDFTWVTAWGTNDNQLINTCTIPWTPTHCEPGILGGSPTRWFIGPNTGVSLWRDSSHQACPDSSLVTTTAGNSATPKWTISQWACPGNNGVAQYVATGAGHAVGSLQGWDGFNMWQSIWDFWTSHWRG